MHRPDRRAGRRTVFALAVLLARPVHGQVVNLWPGAAPGSQHWTQVERAVENTPLGTVIFKVVTPTLTTYLPERAKATGAGGHGFGMPQQGTNSDHWIDIFYHRLHAQGFTGRLAAQEPERQGYLLMSDSARIFYRIAGSGPDTLIAIHGGPGVDLESIYRDFAPLAAHHLVIFYDQRGAGRSELPRDTTRLVVARQIADLDEVRRHFGLRQVTLVAHSYGPLLAASYALAHPDAVRRMVFLGPVPPRRGDFWQRFAANMQLRMDSADAARLAAAAARLRDPAADAVRACRDYWATALKPRLAEPARAQSLIRSDLCASDPAGIRYGLTTTNRVVMASYGDWNLREGLKHLQVPTLVVHGEDEAIPMDLVEEWVTSLPHARLVRVPRAAHFTYAERPDVVWPAVEAFLAQSR